MNDVMRFRRWVKLSPTYISLSEFLGIIGELVYDFSVPLHFEIFIRFFILLCFVGMS